MGKKQKLVRQQPKGAGDWTISGGDLFIRNSANTAWVPVPESFAFGGNVAAAIGLHREPPPEGKGKK